MNIGRLLHTFAQPLFLHLGAHQSFVVGTTNETRGSSRFLLFLTSLHRSLLNSSAPRRIVLRSTYPPKPRRSTKRLATGALDNFLRALYFIGGGACTERRIPPLNPSSYRFASLGFLPTSAPVCRQLRRQTPIPASAIMGLPQSVVYAGMARHKPASSPSVPPSRRLCRASGSTFRSLGGLFRRSPGFQISGNQTEISAGKTRLDDRMAAVPGFRLE